MDAIDGPRSSSSTVARVAVAKCQECKEDLFPGDVAVQADRAGKDKMWHPRCFKCHACRVNNDNATMQTPEENVAALSAAVDILSRVVAVSSAANVSVSFAPVAIISSAIVAAVSSAVDTLSSAGVDTLLLLLLSHMLLLLLCISSTVFAVSSVVAVSSVAVSPTAAAMFHFLLLLLSYLLLLRVLLAVFVGYSGAGYRQLEGHKTK